MLKWTTVCRLSDVPRQGGLVVRTQGADIAVFRTRDDRLFAIDNRCPHRGGPLVEGLVHGHKVTCPLHGWTFDLEDGQAVLPDVGCIPRFPVRLAGEAIQISAAARLNGVGVQATTPAEAAP